LIADATAFGQVDGKRIAFLPKSHAPIGLLQYYLFFDILAMTWTVLALNALVEDEIEALPADMRARLTQLANLIEQNGFETLPRDTVKHLEDKLWQLRIVVRDGISRAIYVTASGKRVIVVRVFVKKSQKTPRNELDLARHRAKEIK
jgi:phage-related protein